MQISTTTASTTAAPTTAPPSVASPPVAPPSVAPPSSPSTSAPAESKGKGKSGKFKPGRLVCTCNVRCAIHSVCYYNNLADSESLDTSDVSAVDELCEALSFVDVADPPHHSVSPRMTVDDMLESREIKETDEVTFPEWMTAKSAFYVVIHGRLTGVFDDWAVASACVTRFSANCHFRRDTVNAAWDEWKRACLSGLVKNRLHNQSLFDKVVSLDELQARADTANVDDFLSEVAQAVAQNERPGVTVNSTPRSAAHVASTSNVPAAASSVQADPNGESLDVKSPPAFVVIIGRRPGVYDSREEWLGAQAKSEGWAFPCSTRDIGEQMFAKYLHLMQVIA